LSAIVRPITLGRDPAARDSPARLSYDVSGF
jgi:hypothetical protein